MRKNSNVNNPTYKECKFSFNKSLPLLKTVLISNTRHDNYLVYLLMLNTSKDFQFIYCNHIWLLHLDT